MGTQVQGPSVLHPPGQPSACCLCPPSFVGAAPSMLGRGRGAVGPGLALPNPALLPSFSYKFGCVFCTSFQKTPFPWLLLSPLPLQQDQFGQMSSHTVSLMYAVDTHIPVYQAVLPRVIHKSNPTHNIFLSINTYKEDKVNADRE